MGSVQPVPLYARVNAAEPHLTAENRERWVAMDRSFLPADDAFFLRHRSDAMTGRGIFDGDWILVTPSARARDGELVAVRRGAHVIVRTVARLGAVLSLTASNGSESEIFLGPSDDFSVLGVVTAVFRSLHEAIDAPDATDAPDDSAVDA